MLPLFDVNIVFNPSRDFLRCITFAHLAAGALLLQSHLHLLLIVVGILLLILSHRSTRRLRSPHPQYKSLTRHARFWILDYSQDHQERYDTVHTHFDGGFFLLLRLTNTIGKKTLILFNDQITLDQHRRLKVLSRIA